MLRKNILGDNEGQAISILLSRAISLQLLLRKNSGTNSTGTSSPTVKRNIAVFMLTWFLVLSFHALTQVHKICLEHGEWIEDSHIEGHSESSKIDTEPEGRYPSFRLMSDDYIHQKHRHCQSLNGLRQIQISPAPEYFSPPILIQTPQERFDGHVSVSKISLLRIAQKTSPPSTVFRV